MGRPRKVISRQQPVREFADALEAAQKSLDLSVTEFGEVLHFSKSTVSRWITGETVPAADQIKPLANRLGPARFAELERLRVVAAAMVARPAVAETPVAETPMAETPMAETAVAHSVDAETVVQPPAATAGRRLSWWWIGGGAAAAVAGVAAVVVPIVRGGPADSGGGDTGRTAVVQVTGNPVYWQCTDRKRSLLSAPGKARGGDTVGALERGAAFVVTAKTDFWRSGYVRDDPRHTRGWVMNEYLSPHEC